MYTYKNAQENVNGSIDCLILLGDEWVAHTQDPAIEYELSEESDWPDVKPCDQSEKDAHAEQQARDQFKAERAQAMQSLTVTTQAGNVFNADETSQTRMSRAITIMDDVETTVWVLADNTPIQATKAELKEALRLAGEAQAALWVQS